MKHLQNSNCALSKFYKYRFYFAKDFEVPRQAAMSLVATKQTFFLVSAAGIRYLAGRTVPSDRGRSYTSQWPGGTVRPLHRSTAERSPSQSIRWDILQVWKKSEMLILLIPFCKGTKWLTGTSCFTSSNFLVSAPYFYPCPPLPPPPFSLSPPPGVSLAPPCAATVPLI